MRRHAPAWPGSSASAIRAMGLKDAAKALMEKAIREFVEKKEIERVENLSKEEKEDLGLLLLMQQVDTSDTVSRDEIMNILDP